MIGGGCDHYQNLHRRESLYLLTSTSTDSIPVYNQSFWQSFHRRTTKRLRSFAGIWILCLLQIVVISTKFNESLFSAVDLPDSKSAHDSFVSAVVISQDSIEVSKDYNEVFLRNGVDKTLKLRVKIFRLLNRPWQIRSVNLHLKEATELAFVLVHHQSFRDSHH